MTDKKRTPSPATLITRVFGRVQRLQGQINKVVARQNRVNIECNDRLRDLRKQKDDEAEHLANMQASIAPEAEE